MVLFLFGILEVAFVNSQLQESYAMALAAYRHLLRATRIAFEGTATPAGALCTTAHRSRRRRPFTPFRTLPMPP